MLNVMATLNDDASTTTTTTTTTTSVVSVGAAVDSESAASDCSTLIDTQALDAALQNGIDGLLSTISDDNIACTSSTVTVSSESAANCLMTASVLPAVSTDTDQHYLFYSAHTDELIDTFLRSTNPGENVEEPAVSGELQAVELTAEDWPVDSNVSGELQAVELTAEDWPVDSLNNDVQMGGMLVEFDSSLLTIIELENDQTSTDGPTEVCLAMAPGGGLSQVVNGETTAWNVFQGLEVSQFQVVGSEQITEATVDGFHTSDECGVFDDSPQNTPGECADETESDANAHSTGSGSNATDDAGCPGDVHVTAVKTDTEQPSNCSPDGSDDEFVLIVDCVDGSDPDEVEYEIVDEADKLTGSALTSPDAAERPEVATSDASDDVTSNS